MARPIEPPATVSQRPSGRVAVLRSAAASVRPDIIGFGPVGVSVTSLDRTWDDSLALALGPLTPHPGPAQVELRNEVWAEIGGDVIGVGAHLHLERTAAGVTLFDRRSGVCGRVEGRVVALSTETGRPGACGRVLPFCLAPPLLGAGAAVVHGAAIGRNGRAVIVLGASGSGKSTVAAAARAAGLSVLSDDVSVVWHAGAWQVQGVARPVRVPSQLAPGSAPVSGDSRGRVSPDGWAVGGTADLVGVVLVGHGDEGSLTRADPVLVARTVVASCFATSLPSMVAPSVTVGRQLSSLPSWALALAADPSIRADLAGRQITSVVDEGRSEADRQ